LDPLLVGRANVVFEKGENVADGIVAPLVGSNIKG
jgi:hypothetical protein